MRIAISFPIHRVMTSAAPLPALATALVWIPPLMTTSQHRSGAWWLLALVAAPVVAFIVNWFRPTATDVDIAFILGPPQVVILPLMAALDVWLDVRNGYYIGGEASMAYGIALTVASAGGVILVLLVCFSGRLGARIMAR
ncbi:MAG: hypothetical protein M3439_12850 [Chloroflexota bacterium]|nr:hypothetical protein [Chloroflexota bacterium]